MLLAKNLVCLEVPLLTCCAARAGLSLLLLDYFFVGFPLPCRSFVYSEVLMSLLELAKADALLLSQTFAQPEAAASLAGYLRFGSFPLVLDFLHLGLSVLVQSPAYMDLLTFTSSKLCFEFPASVTDALDCGAFLVLHASSRSDLPSLLLGFAKLEVVTPANSFALLGSILLLRSSACPELALSLPDRAGLGSSLLLRDLC